MKTAMPIWEAKQHCRDLIVVPASYGKYQKYSSYVREIFRDYTDQVESFGLDEARLDITGSLGLFGDPVKIAKEISDRIKRELGMRDLCSKCNVVEIYVRDNELSGFTRRRKLDNPTNVSIEIARIAFDLFKRNYSWPKHLRGIGVRGADLCPADCAVQLGFFSNEEKREKLEHIDKAVDTLRQRYGYRSVQRAVVYTDPVLGGINAYDDHNIHPVGYFHTA